MNMSMYRKILGYRNGDRKQPIYAPMEHALVTQCVISCSECSTMVSGTMGPRRDAWCIECTDKKEVTDAQDKKDARKKAQVDAQTEKAKRQLEDAAEKKRKAALADYTDFDNE